MSELLKPENIERAAKALWDSETHPMLQAAGYATDYASQPETIKIGLRRTCRLVIQTAMGMEFKVPAGGNCLSSDAFDEMYKRK